MYILTVTRRLSGGLVKVTRYTLSLGWVQTTLPFSPMGSSKRTSPRFADDVPLAAIFIRVKTVVLFEGSDVNIKKDDALPAMI